MTQYDDPVEVRTGTGGLEGPAQFLWRGRLWKVRQVLDRRSQELPRREVWRVAAGRGRFDQHSGTDSSTDGSTDSSTDGSAVGVPVHGGVFDLVHDLPAGRWQLQAAGAGE
ncbi:DUF6504 family protein [Nocardioides abyssi]|uniref:DUF6504 family protein n=1 Tax=Nocardioides abyssi TaxID=3058370 RepID=A0ABT8EYD6_9ACTN|nr:DUF6504 family protein [Nocardioides abyssi]MDN4163200.1 DUF6504 family protein [Nocardioides abyssi]